jgi:4-hydroxybenzoate polyprenyltransferase
MKYYIKLARPHHWVKNALVLLPLLGSGQFLEWGKLRAAIWGFFAFSFLASAIYVINDIRDREKDRHSTTKCGRPIAAGYVSTSQAIVFCVVLLLLAGFSGWMASALQWKAWSALGAYFLLNLGYSLGLKNVPLVDIVILVSGYLLRMIYGGAVTDIVLSKWLCLTVIAMSFYLGLGKRRGELMGQKKDTRAVLKYYSRSFLEQNMYMCAALAVVFYSLWTVDAMTTQRVGSENLLWTVPLVILICMKYSLDVEGNSDGDPVEVLLHDKVLLLLGAILALVIFSLIYL